MADGAEVVPLRRNGGRSRGHRAMEPPGPAAFFVDAADPDRALSVAWSLDAAVVEIGIATADDAPATLVLDAQVVLELARALVEGLPEAGGRRPRPSAPVLPLKPRKSHPSPDGS